MKRRKDQSKLGSDDGHAIMVNQIVNSYLAEESAKVVKLVLTHQSQQSALRQSVASKRCVKA
jgi:hypothetical protein